MELELTNRKVPIPIADIKAKLMPKYTELYYDTRDYPTPTVEEIVRLHSSQFEPLLAQYLCKYDETIIPSVEAKNKICQSHLNKLKATLGEFLKISLIKVVTSLYDPVAKQNKPPCPHEWFLLNQNPEHFYPCITRHEAEAIVQSLGVLAQYCFPDLRPKIKVMDTYIRGLNDTMSCKDIAMGLLPHINATIDIISDPERMLSESFNALLENIKQWLQTKGKALRAADNNRYRAQIISTLHLLSPKEVALFKSMEEYGQIYDLMKSIQKELKVKYGFADQAGGYRSRLRQSRLCRSRLRTKTRKLSRH
jgi:hypothetical protein